MRNEQYKVYNKLKADMPENSILLHVDYAENYENKQQGECQSAYFGHTSFSIFTGAAFIRSNGKLEKICFVIVSEAKDHSRIAAHSCIVKAIDIVMTKHTYLKTFEDMNIHIWSDGCSTQFRSRYVFHLTTLFPTRYNVVRYYNERHHGKGPMDGIGGCIKNAVYRAVMSTRVVVQTPLDFVNAARSLVRGVECIYMPVDEVMVEPEEISNAPYVPDMQILQVHKAVRVVTKKEFQCLQLFKIGTDTKSYFDQWYRRHDGAKSCGHLDIPESLNPEKHCGKCLEGENGDEWLQCPVCTNWYHEGCFYN